MRTAEVKAVFGTIRPVLTALARDAPRVDASFLERPFPVAGRRRSASRATTLGLGEGAWRLDPDRPSVLHVVLDPGYPTHDALRRRGLQSIWATLHEAGHGLYAHGIAPTIERSPLAGLPSLGLNESQSRTWENLVGRSRAVLAPLVRAAASYVPVTARRCRPRRVSRRRPPRRAPADRVDADETTYSLHIILRFELEQELIEGTLDPGICRRRGTQHAGVSRHRGSRRRRGVLQDVHWSQGGIGYFPTYALGNVISLQIWLPSRRRSGSRPADGGRRAPSSCRRGFATTSTRSVGSSRPWRPSNGLRERRESTPSRTSRTSARSWPPCPPVPDTVTFVVNGERRSLDVEVGHCSCMRCVTISGSRAPTWAATRASAARAPCSWTAAR